MEAYADAPTVGRTLTALREHAGMTQSALSKAMRTNTTRVCRIENGDACPSGEEIDGYLQVLDTAATRDYRDYLHSEWESFVPRPSFPHPNWRTLQLIDGQLAGSPLSRPTRRPRPFSSGPSIFTPPTSSDSPTFSRQWIITWCSSASSASVKRADLFNGGPGTEPAGAGIRPTDGAGGRSGRITLCEVQIQSGPAYGLIVEPCTDEEVRHFVLDYSDQLLAEARHPIPAADSPKAPRLKVDEKSGPPDEVPWLSEELARAIRGLAGLSEARPLPRCRLPSAGPQLAIRDPQQNGLVATPRHRHLAACRR